MSRVRYHNKPDQYFDSGNNRIHPDAVQFYIDQMEHAEERAKRGMSQRDNYQTVVKGRVPYPSLLYPYTRVIEVEPNLFPQFDERVRILHLTGKWTPPRHIVDLARDRQWEPPRRRAAVDVEGDLGPKSQSQVPPVVPRTMSNSRAASG